MRGIEHFFANFEVVEYVIPDLLITVIIQRGDEEAPFGVYRPARVLNFLRHLTVSPELHEADHHQLKLGKSEKRKHIVVTNKRRRKGEEYN